MTDTTPAQAFLLYTTDAHDDPLRVYLSAPRLIQNNNHNTHSNTNSTTT